MMRRCRDDVAAAKDLELARAALGRGDLKRALRKAWGAARSAVPDDELGLEAVGELAAVLQERSSGRIQKEAQVLAAYCSHCLSDLREGRPQGSMLERLFRTPGARSVKTCPDCAEEVRAAARICRFCGYRFDGAGT